MTIEQRLNRLERQNRRLKFGGMVLLLGFGAVFLMGHSSGLLFFSPSTPSIPSTLDTYMTSGILYYWQSPNPGALGLPALSVP